MECCGICESAYFVESLLLVGKLELMHRKLRTRLRMYMEEALNIL